MFIHRRATKLETKHLFDTLPLHQENWQNISWVETIPLTSDSVSSIQAARLHAQTPRQACLRMIKAHGPTAPRCTFVHLWAFGRTRKRVVDFPALIEQIFPDSATRWCKRTHLLFGGPTCSLCRLGNCSELGFDDLPDLCDLLSCCSLFGDDPSLRLDHPVDGSWRRHSPTRRTHPSPQRTYLFLIHFWVFLFLCL